MTKSFDSVHFWDPKVSSRKPVFNVTSVNNVNLTDILFPHLLVQGSLSNHIDYIDLRKQKSILQYKPEQDITAMKFLPNAKGFVTGDNQGIANVYNFTKKDQFFQMEVHGSFQRPIITSFSFLDDFLIYGSQTGMFNIINLKSNLLVYQKFLGFPIVSTDVSSRNEMIGYSLSNDYENSVGLLKSSQIFENYTIGDFSKMIIDGYPSWEQKLTNENNTFFEKKEFYPGMKTKFEDFPIEILETIISFIDVNSFIHLSLVNRHFFESLTHLHVLNVPFQIKNTFRFKSLESVSFSPFCYRFLADTIQNLTILAHPSENLTIDGYKKLKTLSVKNCKFLHLKNIFQDLEELHLYSCASYKMEYINTVNKQKSIVPPKLTYNEEIFFPSLKNATLYNSEFDVSFIGVILAMPLVYCNVSYTQIHLSETSKLEEYHCQGSLNTETSIKRLEAIIKESMNLRILNSSFNSTIHELNVDNSMLQSLDLRGCFNLNKLKLNCKNLKNLYIGGTSIPDKELKELKLQNQFLNIDNKY